MTNTCRCGCGEQITDTRWSIPSRPRHYKVGHGNVGIRNEATEDLIIRDGFTSCWHWAGVRIWNGYGVLSVRCKQVRAHRFIYERHRGPIQKGMVLDHLCRNRICVNPDHLEQVTPAENSRRAMAANRTGTCKRGHKKDGINRDGYPHCMTCNRAYGARSRAKLRAKREAVTA